MVWDKPPVCCLHIIAAAIFCNQFDLIRVRIGLEYSSARVLVGEGRDLVQPIKHMEPFRHRSVATYLRERFALNQTFTNDVCNFLREVFRFWELLSDYR